MTRKQTKRQLQAQETKLNIYNCASRLFEEKGFDNVTIEDIAGESGVSVGLFYYYFKSKHEILAIYHRNLDVMYSEYYQNAVSSGRYEGKTVLEQLEDFMLYTCEICGAGGAAYIRIVYSYMLTETDFSKAMIDPERLYFDILHKLLSKGLKNKEIRQEFTTTQLASDIVKMTRGCIVDWCVGGGDDSIRERSKRLIQTFLRGIKRNPQEPESD